MIVDVGRNNNIRTTSEQALRRPYACFERASIASEIRLSQEVRCVTIMANSNTALMAVGELPHINRLQVHEDVD